MSEVFVQKLKIFSRTVRANELNTEVIVIFQRFCFVLVILENYDQAELADIQSELKIMIHVGEHENILNILGACTKGWLKYCQQHSMQSYEKNCQT